MRVPRDLSGLEPQETPGAPRAPWRTLDPDERSGERGLGTDGRVLEFKRRLGLPVRRKSRWRELARHFATALALVGLPAAALWWSATSPRFDLARLEVETADRVNQEWVEERLAHLVGQNLVWMSMQGVERSLGDHPWIRGVAVSKSLPDRMRVSVVERLPVAVLESAAGTFYVDRDGRVIAPAGAADAPPATGGRTGDYLVLRDSAPGAGASGKDRVDAPAQRERRLRHALDAAQALSRVDVGWGSGLTEVEVLGEEDLILRSRELPFPLLVESGTVEARARVLREWMPELTARVPRPDRIDLRFENRMVVRPAAEISGAGSDDRRGELHGQTG